MREANVMDILDTKESSRPRAREKSGKDDGLYSWKKYAKSRAKHVIHSRTVHPCNHVWVKMLTPTLLIIVSM